MTYRGSLHRERSAQTAHSALMATLAPCMAFAVAADPFRRTTTRSERGSFKRLSICRKCLEHLRVRFPNLTRRSASTSAIAGVGSGNISTPQKHPLRENSHGSAQFGGSIVLNVARHYAALKWAYAVCTSRGCNPGHERNGPFSVALRKRLQALPAVVVCHFFKSPSRQKQLQAHRERLVGGLHLKALGCTPSVGASQP